MQFTRGKNPTCSICFSTSNLSNFAVVRSFRKFGGMEFGIAGSDKCNAIVIFSLKLWLKHFCQTVVYDML